MHSVSPASNRFPLVIATLLLVFMAVLSGGAALRESITVDEVAHIGAGVSYLQKLDLRMNEEHPPLAKVLAAIPLVLRGVHADYSDNSWTFSSGIYQHMLGEWPWGHALALRWNDAYSTVMWARVPMLLLTLALSVFVYRYASELGGPWGGLLCLVAYVTTPAFLVFGPLVLTDMTVTFFTLLVLWRFAELWREPSRKTMIWFGVLLGCAFLSKFSAGLLLFCFLAFRLGLRFLPVGDLPKDPAELRAWRRLRGRYMWEGILVAALTSYAVYFILSWNEPTDSLKLLGNGAASLILRRLLMPPWMYLRGLAFFVVGAGSRPTFLLGHSYPHGVWFYFPVIFVLKSTLAFLLMLLMAVPIALLARSRRKGAAVIPAGQEFHWRAVWVFLLVFVAACMLSRLTISIRHFTVPIVLLILLLAPVPRILEQLFESGWRMARVAMGAYVVLALWSAVTVVRTYPYLFPFVNSLGSGHEPYELVNDSNVDWNQSLPEVNRFMQQRGISHALLDEYGFTDPRIYTPQAEFWNCQVPVASDAGQWAFVSAGMIEDGQNCVWLLHYPHQALAGGSMYAFQLPAVIPPVGDPAGPPPVSEYRNWGGAPIDIREIFMKCVLDPNQLQPTMEHMMAEFQAQNEKSKKKN
jgi:hypothetical protein